MTVHIVDPGSQTDSSCQVKLLRRNVSTSHVQTLLALTRAKGSRAALDMRILVLGQMSEYCIGTFSASMGMVTDKDDVQFVRQRSYGFRSNSKICQM